MRLGNKGKKKEGAEKKKKKKRQGVQDLNLGCSIYTYNFFFLNFFKNSSMDFKNSDEHPKQQVAPPLAAAAEACKSFDESKVCYLKS